MAWWDTAASWANSLGSIYNAAKPLINTGASIYDRNQTRGAISDAFEQYKGYADKSLGALGQVYEEGKQATAPYRTAGQLGLGGYMNLLNDPSQIRNDPGYQWRTNQGAEAVTRKAASNRLLGSGNFATALQDYGQNQATAELDSALNRQVPLMQAGQTATGQLMDAGRNYSYGVGQINRGLGEAAGAARLGQAGATSDMLTDILGQNSQGGTLSNLGSNLNTANSLNTLYGQLSNAGNGSALAGAQEVASQTGQGTWGDLTTGPRTAAQMPAVGLAANAAPLAAAGLGGAGLAGFGTTAGTAGALGAGGFGAGLGAAGLGGTGIGGATTLPGMGGTAAAFEGMTSGIGAGVGTGGSTAAAGGAAAGSIGLLSSLGIAGGIIGLGKALGNLSGGASDRNKVSEADAYFQRSPQEGYQNLDNIINNVKWANEWSNVGVINSMVDRGVINADYPTLHSANSIVDVWNGTAFGNRTMTSSVDAIDGGPVFMSPTLEAQVYGLSPALQQQYVTASNQLTEAVGKVDIDREENRINYIDHSRGSDYPRSGGAYSIFDVPAGAYVKYRPDGDDTRVIPANQLPGYTQVQEIRSQYMTEDRKRMYASALYDNYRSTGYQGDLSKLERYLGV